MLLQVLDCVLGESARSEVDDGDGAVGSEEDGLDDAVETEELLQV